MLEKSEAMKEEFDSKKQQIMDDYEQFKEEFTDSMKTVGTVSNPQPPPTVPPEKDPKKIEKTSQKTKKPDSKTIKVETRNKV